MSQRLITNPSESVSVCLRVYTCAFLHGTTLRVCVCIVYMRVYFLLNTNNAYYTDSCEIRHAIHGFEVLTQRLNPSGHASMHSAKWRSVMVCCIESGLEKGEDGIVRGFPACGRLSHSIYNETPARWCVRGYKCCVLVQSSGRRYSVAGPSSGTSLLLWLLLLLLWIVVVVIFFLVVIVVSVVVVVCCRWCCFWNCC